MKRIVLLCAVLWVSLLVSGCGAMQAKQIDPISVETAKALALKAVGLTTEQVSFTTVDLETQGGLDYYAVRFTAGGRSYSYEIDALSGVVIDGQPDYDESAAGQQEAQTSPGESLVTDADSFGSVPTQTQPGGTQEGNADAVSSATVQQQSPAPSGNGDMISAERSYKDVDKFRKICYDDLDKAMSVALAYNITDVCKKCGRIPHYTFEAYNYYLKYNKDKETL